MCRKECKKMNALGKWISNETARPFLARKELWIDKKITKF